MTAGFPSPSGITALLVLVTVFHGLAFISTTFRLWFRYHIRRIWWEDIWAALSLCFDMICLAGMWTLTAPLAQPGEPNSVGAITMSRQSHVASYWLLITSYTCTLWCARLSIVFSVIRIVPPSRVIRSISFLVAILFVLMWILVLTVKVYSCAHNTSWYSRGIIQCPIPTDVAIIEICTDVVADAVLVGLPLRLLWRVKLPKNQRIMILAIFSSSILTSVVSAVHTAYLIPTSSFIGGVTAEIEGALSLVVCNLLVIVTFIYRVRQNGTDLSTDLSTSPGTNTTTRSENRLTTVDLDFQGDMSVFTGTHSTAKETFGSVAATTGSVLAASRGESDVARLASTGAHQLSILPALSSIPQSTKEER
ncbi:hypothetical protein BV22DRAFT_1129308 [Leucogyrophana mollusca]|uniref:Uncharacterized protein n=1 Tax=Leucogyrophana mollusca TaxID=85980 RepID=A0ACB8BGV3_9AGAM|nr:hypothetical protein BV22DRAFT_1129308 [Leucogyrophana mollusca]